MKSKISLFFILFFANITFVGAQVLDYNSFNNNQESAQFYFLENSIVKVVYRKNQKKRAMQIIRTISNNLKAINKGFKHPHKKITIILRSNTMLSNGYVRLAPYKSEFFDAPFIQGELDFGNWLDTLAIHEFRHVSQFSQQYDGFTKFMYYFMGETGVAIASNWSIPTWAFEGDAVIAETELSDSGRGRSAAFSARLRQLILEKTDLTYEELYFGTDNNLMPDYYKIGYFFLMFLSEEYAYQAKEGFSLAPSSSYNPFSFLNTIEAHTNKSIDVLFYEFQLFYKKKWATNILLKNTTQISPKNSHYTANNYLFINSHDEIIYLKTGVKEIKHFVKLKGQEEKVLHYPGYIVSNSINSNKDSIYWTEIRVNPRWNSMSYTVVCELNTHSEDVSCNRWSGREVTVDYLDKKYLLSVFDGTSKVLISLKDGVAQKEILKSEEGIYINPFFIDKDLIAFIFKDKMGLFSIETFDLTSNKRTKYLTSKKSIRRAISHKGKIYFEWENDQSEDIYSLDLATKTIFQLTSSKYSSINPFVKDNTLYVSNLGAGGYNILSLPIKESPLTNANRSNEIIPKRILVEDSFNETAVESGTFDDDIFNVHSWVLLPPIILPAWSLSAVSDNISETIHSEVGIASNTNENTNSIFANISYRGFFPYFDFGISGGKRSVETAEDKFDSTWTEIDSFLGTKVSLSNVKGRWFNNFQLAIYANSIEIKDKKINFKNDYKNGKLTGGILHSSFTLVSAKEAMRKRSPIAFNVDTTLKTAKDSKSDQKARLFNIKTDMSFGIWAMGNLSLHHEKEVQHESSDAYQYESLVIQARGYYLGFSNDITLSKLDLSFPLYFPNYAVGDYLYFKRLDLGLFYDSMDIKNIQESTGNSIHTSYGLEVTTKINFFKTFVMPLGFGVRYIYKNSPYRDEKGNVTEIFIDAEFVF